MKVRIAQKTGRKRRWWQYLLRVAAAAATLCVGLYATLPWWLPTDRVARWIQQELSEQIGAPVTVAGVSVSWGDGLQIDRLTVANPAGFGDEPLLTTSRIRVDFSPLTMAVAGRIGWMTVESPRLRVSVDADGRLNLAHVRLPVFDVITSRISIQNGLVSTSLPRLPEPLVLRVTDLQVQANRWGQFGRVTLSAELPQPAGAAPISLDVRMKRSTTGRQEALLELSFAEVDLATLPLAEALGMPLPRLAGTCKGSARVPVRRGLVTGGKLEIGIRRLSVQPQDGPELPVIEQAGLNLLADVDLATQLVNVQALDLRAPGVDLNGRGKFHASLLQGHWLGGRTLRLGGTLDPQAVVAMLPVGSESLAGWPEVQGQVQLQLTYDRLGQGIEATVALDASAATILAEGRTVKPAGEPLGCTLQAKCKPRTWQFAFDRTELRLGGNRFVGRGALANVRQLLASWGGEGPATPVASLWSAVGGLDWAGECEIAELGSLRRLHPAVEDALADVTLDGTVRGSWRLDHRSGTELHVAWSCDRGSRLRVGDWLNKDDTRRMELALNVRGDEGGRLRQALVELTCGDGMAYVRLDELSCQPGGEDMEDAGWAKGQFHLDRVEEIIRCVPYLAGRTKQLSGGLRGGLSVQIGRELLRLNGTCDATQLRFCAGEVLDKQIGQPVEATWNWLWDFRKQVSVFDLRASLPGAEAEALWTGRRDRWSARAHLAVSDAAWLGSQSPALGWSDRNWRVSGAMTVHADLAGTRETIAGRLDLVADDLDLAASPPHRQKPRGVPARVSVEAELGRETDGRPATLTLGELAVRFGPSTVEGSGRWVAGAGDRPGTMELAGQVEATLDPELQQVLPELREWIDRGGLAGKVAARWRLTGEGATLQASGELNATDLAVRPVGAQFVKPAGMPAVLELEATLPEDLSALIVNDWRGRVGPMQGMGDARVSLAGLRGDREAPGPTLLSEFRLWTNQAENLAELMPALADLAPTGDVEVFGRALVDANGIRLPYATVQLDGLGVEYRQRRVKASGAVLIQRVAVTNLRPVAGAPGVESAGPSVRVGRVASDDLRIIVGPSEATVVMDLRNVLANPQGMAAVLGEQIDASDLRGWLTGPVQSPPPLTDDYKLRLQRRAAEWIELARRRVAGADVTLVADFGLVRNWPDDKVKQVYDARNVALQAAVKAGVVTFGYTAGVNGGTIIDRSTIDLNAEAPQLALVSQVRDMMATKNLQPQVADVFPGNELRGTMWRDLEIRTALDEAILNAMDPRLPTRPVGQGKITLIEGVTRGRAAPRFVTRVFRGLNLVEYEYKRMIGFTEHRADGSTYNDMVFSGKTYDLYIEGVTDAERVGRYEVGVILAGTLQSPEWNHRFKQGRVPVLKFKAKLVGGKKVDEEISYPWPNETMFTIFLKNNYFYKLWAARRTK